MNELDKRINNTIDVVKEAIFKNLDKKSNEGVMKEIIKLEEKRKKAIEKNSNIQD